MNTETLIAELAAVDRAALAAAAGAAEEALACHRAALLALADGWQSETGCAVTDQLQRQCAEARDIVTELHRAAAELVFPSDGSAGPVDTFDDDWGAAADDVQAARQSVPPVPDPAAPAPEAAGGVAAPPPPTAPIDGFSAAPVAAGPGVAQPAGWGTPPAAAPIAPSSWPSAELPDLGGTLVGLVAQIAQALGSYGEAGDAGETVPMDADGGRPPLPAPQPDPVDSHPQPGAAASGQAGGAVPESPVPPPPVPIPPPAPPATQPPVPAEGPPLAAERPADPPPAAPPPVNPQPGAAPAEPPPAAPPRKPCEIAADALAQVGE